MMDSEQLEDLIAQLKDLNKYLESIIEDCPDVCDDYGITEGKIEEIKERINNLDELIGTQKNEDKEYLNNEYLKSRL